MRSIEVLGTQRMLTNWLCEVARTNIEFRVVQKDWLLVWLRHDISSIVTIRLLGK